MVTDSLDSGYRIESGTSFTGVTTFYEFIILDLHAFVKTTSPVRQAYQRISGLLILLGSGEVSQEDLANNLSHKIAFKAFMVQNS